MQAAEEEWRLQMAKSDEKWRAKVLGLENENKYLKTALANEENQKVTPSYPSHSRTPS